jgi:regulator of protease activity HflC (stomatin/prohibitin superfamily)
MKRLFLSILIVFGFGCTTVDPQNVGIIVHKTGSNRGVETTPYTGRVWYNPFVDDVVVFPVTAQNPIWSKAPHEGSPGDESLTFSVKGGIPVNVDVQLTYHVDPRLAHKVFKRYGMTDLDALADGPIRNFTRDALAHEAASMDVQELLSGGRNDLLARALARIQHDLTPLGLIVEQITFSGAPRLPDNVQHAINASLEAQQRLVQAQAQAQSEVATAEGHARAARAEADGRAAASRTLTQADADNLRLRAEAEHDANNRVRDSLTPEVLRYRMINRWDGVLAPSTGSSTLLLNPTAQ